MIQIINFCPVSYDISNYFFITIPYSCQKTGISFLIKIDIMLNKPFYRWKTFHNQSIIKR